MILFPPADGKLYEDYDHVCLLTRVLPEPCAVPSTKQLLVNIC